MKRIFALSIMFAFLFSCTQYRETDDSTQLIGDSEIKFQFLISPTTKMTTDENFKCSFGEGDQIGLFAVSRPTGGTAPLLSADNYADNIKFELIDGVWVNHGEALLYPKDGRALDFYAYYPYAADADPTNIAYDASSKSYDLMTARIVGRETSGGDIAMTFSHKLALVQTEITGLGTRVNMLGVGVSGTLDLSAADQEDEFVISADGPVDAPMTKIAGNVFRLYLPAQQLTVGELFSIKSGIKNPKYTAQANVNLAAGKVKKYNVTADVTDLGGMPNCYIVKSGQSVDIPVLKAYEMWRMADVLLSVPGVDLTGALSAELVWQDADGLIPSGGIAVAGGGEQAKITVSTAPDKTGNAVVAVKIGGVVRWSWHIWVTDYNPDSPTGDDKTYAYDNNSDGMVDYVFMDRNLGAGNTTVGDLDNLGLYYQWGRKDPFPRPSSFASATTTFAEIYDMNGPTAIAMTNCVVATPADTVTNMNIAITQPATFIKDPANMDWLYKTADYGHDRWSTSANPEKTPYDPCPAGWMMPIYKNGIHAWEAARIAGATTTHAGTGLYWEAYGYYQLSGRIRFDNGLFNGLKGSGFLWSAELNPAGKPFLIQMATGVSPNNYSAANAVNVRCVKE